MPEPRAIIFDLDDTLYPYQAFVRSGFRAVGRQLAEERGLPLRGVLRVLRKALSSGDRGRELQALCARFALPPSLVPILVAVMREHAPRLRLPRESAHVLKTLAAAGWTIGILTNGNARVQQRKVAALGVDLLVNGVIYAAEHAAGGKPSPAAFRAALRRLDVEADRAVFVGDDPDADITGAAAVGMATIHVVTDRPADRPCGLPMCATHVTGMAQVPDLATALLQAREPVDVC